MKKISFDDYYAYWQEVTPILVEAENTIKAIKGTDKWKRVSNYFHVLYNRGELKENPTSKNGYRIERRDRSDVVALSDIESILTPEQLTLIKQMKGENHE